MNRASTSVGQWQKSLTWLIGVEKYMTQKTLIYRFKNLTAKKTTRKHIIIKLFKN